MSTSPESSLAKLQQQFQDYIFTGSNKILDDIIDTDKVSAASRLDIYRNAYIFRLIDILAMDFVVVKEILEGEKFAEIAKQYINACPSKHFSIRIFGQHFAEFLQAQPELEPALAELALLEWKLARVLDAANAPHISLEDMGKIAPQDWAIMQFTCHPIVEVLTFNYNTAFVWQAYETEATLYEFELLEQPQNYLIWRKELRPCFMPINEVQMIMFQALQKGKTFGEICEELCEFLPEEEVIQFAAGSLRNWVAQGIFAEVHLI